MKRATLVLAVLLFTLGAFAQVNNTQKVIQYKGATTADKITAAQAACIPNLTCIIEIDPMLPRNGVDPAKCATCIWVDWRDPSSSPLGGTPSKEQLGFVNLVTMCGVSTSNTGAQNNAAVAACFAANGIRTYRFPASSTPYPFASTINFDIGGAILECEGSAALGDWGTGVRLNFPADTAGVSMSGNGGQKFRGCRLVSASPWTYQVAPTFVVPYGFGGANTAALKADCVQIRGHGIEVSDVSCEQFGRHGINIDTTEFGGNQNQWRVRNVRLYYNRGAGLHVRGGDANIGLSQSVDAGYNQFGGILDGSFLGSVHIAAHTDGNHYDATNTVSTCNITNKARASNVITYTCPSHGFAPMDSVSITGTGYLDGKFTVFSTPDANNFTIKFSGSDLASVAGSGTAGRTAAYNKWRYSPTNCAITSGSNSLTCDTGFVPDSMRWDLISIPGAGVAGAPLNSWITLVNSGTTVTLGTVASTTVTGATAAVALNGPDYKMTGDAQSGCALIAAYSEGAGAGFGMNQTGSTCLVQGGTQGAGWDATTGAANTRQDNPNIFYGGLTVRNADYPASGLGTAITLTRNAGSSSVIDWDLNNTGAPVEMHRFDFSDAALVIKDSRTNGPSISLNKTGLIQIQAKAGAATSVNFCSGCSGDIQIADGAASPANTILLKGASGRGVFTGGVAVESTNNVTITAGTGVPSAGACTASTLGALYLNKSGGASTSLYVCTAAGVWTAK